MPQNIQNDMSTGHPMKEKKIKTNRKKDIPGRFLKSSRAPAA
jgi:hypothetical protein